MEKIIFAAKAIRVTDSKRPIHISVIYTIFKNIGMPAWVIPAEIPLVLAIATDSVKAVIASKPKAIPAIAPMMIMTMKMMVTVIASRISPTSSRCLPIWLYSVDSLTESAEAVY